MKRLVNKCMKLFSSTPLGLAFRWAPSISSQPATAVGFPRSTKWGDFSVCPAAGSSPINYYWLKDGTSLADGGHGPVWFEERDALTLLVV